MDGNNIYYRDVSHTLQTVSRGQTSTVNAFNGVVISPWEMSNSITGDYIQTRVNFMVQVVVFLSSGGTITSYGQGV